MRYPPRGRSGAQKRKTTNVLIPGNSLHHYSRHTYASGRDRTTNRRVRPHEQYRDGNRPDVRDAVPLILWPRFVAVEATINIMTRDKIETNKNAQFTSLNEKTGESPAIACAGGDACRENEKTNRPSETERVKGHTAKIVKCPDPSGKIRHAL